jgi:hypothetical protein
VIQEHQQPRRTLKIEAEGDPWKGVVKPKIRLMGRWLEQAGFRPGLRVQITCVAAGVIELRSDAPALLPAEPGQLSPEPPPNLPRKI